MELDVPYLFSSSFIFIYYSVSLLSISKLVLILLLLLIFWGGHHHMILLKRLACLVHPIWMKSLWSGVTRDVAVFRIYRQFLLLGFQWLSLHIPLSFHLVWNVYHKSRQVGILLCRKDQFLHIRWVQRSKRSCGFRSGLCVFWRDTRWGINIGLGL